MAPPKKWQLTGDYFENCNCDVVCPCLVSAGAPLTARPSQGVCDVALVFHIEKGRYDNVPLDGLNVAVIAHTPGPMGEGNWTLAAYIDERADDAQTAALGAIFGGARGRANGGLRAARRHASRRAEGRDQIRDQRQEPVGAKFPASCRWRCSPWGRCTRAARSGQRSAIRSRRTSWHSRWALTGSTFADHGMRWDNSGKNGHYAPISWSN